MDVVDLFLYSNFVGCHSFLPLPYLFFSTFVHTRYGSRVLLHNRTASEAFESFAGNMKLDYRRSWPGCGYIDGRL